MTRRRISQYLMVAVSGLCALVCALILLAVVWSIVKRGAAALQWQFFTEQIRMVGASGGIFHNIVGTVILISTAFLCAAPVALSIALVHGFYLAGQRAKEFVTLLLYILNGVPSIIFGIFGMILFVQWLGWGKSWLSGGILLALMILPTVTISIMSAMEAIPKIQIDSAVALGLRRSQVIRSIVLPRSVKGLVTGSLLGLARAAGETAPIMFTATIFAGATLPRGIKESPVLSLPYHIFILAQDSFDPSVGSKLWGTALTLLIMVFGMSLLALPSRIKIRQSPHHD